jgi:hypothetical protein
MSKWPHILQFSTCRITLKRCQGQRMALMSTQSDDLRTHLREGALYRDRSNNFI